MCRFTLSVPALCFAFSWLPAAPVPKGADRQPIYWNTVVGSKCVYKDELGERSSTITKVQECDDNTIITIKHEAADGTICSEILHVCAKGLYRVEFAGDKFNPPICLLTLPAKVGQKWTVASTNGQSTLAGTGTAEIIAIETVKVPAGGFEAVCVKRCFTLKGDDKEERKSTIWFAQGVGIIKYESGTSVLVLKAHFPPDK